MATETIMKKATVILGSALALVSLNPSAAMAAGDKTTKTVCTTSYGGTTECREEEVPRETAVHDVTEVNTGVVENVVLATGLLGVGLVLLYAAQREHSTLLK